MELAPVYKDITITIGLQYQGQGCPIYEPGVVGSNAGQVNSQGALSFCQSWMVKIKPVKNRILWVIKYVNPYIPTQTPEED